MLPINMQEGNIWTLWTFYSASEPLFIDGIHFLSDHRDIIHIINTNIRVKSMVIQFGAVN